MKNALYFTSKAQKVNFQFYDITTWLTNNCNIYCPRGKGNQTVKFGQSSQCNMRTIFLKKSYTKYDGETSSRFFSEKLKLTISLDQWSKVLYSLFLLYGKLRPVEIY